MLIGAAYLLFFSCLVARDIPVCCGHLITQNVKQEVWSGGTRWHQICSSRWLMIPTERISVICPRTECLVFVCKISAVRQSFSFPRQFLVCPLYLGRSPLPGVLWKTWKALRCGRTQTLPVLKCICLLTQHNRNLNFSF